MSPLLRSEYYDLAHSAELLHEHETTFNGNPIKIQIFNDSGIKVLAVIYNNQIISLTIITDNPAK